MRVKIYSNEHNAWWKDNYCGYTKDESKAGIFEIEEVNKKYPYIDFDTTKEDYLVKFDKLTYEELEKENQELKDTNMKYAKLIDDFQAKNMLLEKVLEIIKSKNVDTFYLANCFNCGGLERYNRHAQQYHMGTLKKVEYDLLKEVLKV